MTSLLNMFLKRTYSLCTLRHCAFITKYSPVHLMFNSAAAIGIVKYDILSGTGVSAAGANFANSLYVIVQMQFTYGPYFCV